MKVVLASSNQHKVKEINEIVSETAPSIGLEFILPPSDFDPIEDGETFEENSYIKARAAWELTKTWTLADDSGLCIDALNGRPGIYSARYAETPQLRIERVLNEMKNVPEEKRNARFVCSMTLINPAGEIEFKYTGVCTGHIINEPKGLGGFGYDPVFVPSGYSKTIAELTETEKNAISHRGLALQEVLKYLISVLKDV